ncbi:MAG: DUF4416 family protein [Candidatus Omnitrophica bacterium]|nr:DUF4416 family protein [Candidatus Omnitrophota bacterium]
MIFKDIELFGRTKASLIRRLGPVDFESDLLNFDRTDYYRDEMGKDLKRKFLTFRRLRRADGIHRLKLLSNSLERRSSASGKRIINIDPGYITPAKLILLTTKDFAHRIYIKDGIYAEVTLSYKDKSYRSYEWTYPDYNNEYTIDFFNQARSSYLETIKRNRND